jgi:hypothetical protein
MDALIKLFVICRLFSPLNSLIVFVLTGIAVYLLATIFFKEQHG